MIRGEHDSVDAAQDHLAPGYELCVAQKGVDFAVFQACQQVVDGAFQTGVLNLGLQEGGVSLQTYDDRTSADVNSVMRQYEQMIISGEVVPPVDDATLASFVAPEMPAMASPVASPMASPESTPTA